jgi:hypothetical protein
MSLPLSMRQFCFDHLKTAKILHFNGGSFHDQADDERIVIRGPFRGHNDTPFGRPIPGRLVGRPGVGHPQGVFGVFSYYLLVMFFS